MKKASLPLVMIGCALATSAWADGIATYADTGTSAPVAAAKDDAQDQHCPLDLGPVFAASLKAWWSAHRFYPAQALDVGEGGEVQISLIVDRSGHVLDVKIKKKSGSEILDLAAQSTWRDAALSPLPDKLNIEQVMIDVTLHYEIDNHSPVHIKVASSSDRSELHFCGIAMLKPAAPVAASAETPWYVIGHDQSGTARVCKVSVPGPADIMRASIAVGAPLNTRDESDQTTGQIVESTMEVIPGTWVTFYRERNRCEKALAALIAAEARAVEKYR